MDNAPPRQRSPWFYVLLGCGGLAAFMCILGSIFVFVLGKQVKDMSSGMSDPDERRKNAIEQLGAMPEGYHVVASLSVFGVMKTTVLTDQAPLADGGFLEGGRTFNYFRAIANEQAERTKAFFDGRDPSGEGLREGGVGFDPQTIIKRGELKVEGRKVLYVVMRGRVQGREAGLTNAVMFICPDTALRFGLWNQDDPSPEVEAEKLGLEGTVADEAEVARFLKPINPCGR